MARRTYLRASDADREAVAERLRHATVEGRLLAEELEERLEAVFAARTYGELDALVADLPAPRPQHRRQPVRAQRGIAHWIVPVLVMAIVFPIVVAAVVAVAVFLLTGMFTVWVVWLALAWFFFGHRRMRYASRRRIHWTRF